MSNAEQSPNDELRASEERFRSLIELSTDYYWETDAEHRKTRFEHNSKYRLMRPVPEQLGTPRWDRPNVYPDAAGWAAYRAAVEARKPIVDFEYARLNSAGELCWRSISGEPFYSASGEFLGYRGIGRDITERKEAERRLRESEARFRTLIELTSDWYWEQDAELRFSRVESRNLSRQELDPPSELLGKRRWEIGYDNVTEAEWEAHKRLLERREPFRGFIGIQHNPNGGVRSASEVSGEPIFDAGGRFAGYRGVGRDITDRVAAERRVREFNAELEACIAERTSELQGAIAELESFTTSVAHDLRAPLRSVAGFGQMLQEDYGESLPPAGRDYLRRMLLASDRMTSMIDGLLELSRLSRKEPRRSRVNLSALAAEILVRLQEVEPERRVQLSIQAGIEADCDPSLIVVVLENLLGNAWKYTARATRAEIAFGGRDSDAGESVFFVRDNGVGFDMRYVSKLFTAFQRLHSADEFPGTGIGLSTARKVIQRHGGRIWGESRPGDGAVFCFTLEPGPSAR